MALQVPKRWSINAVSRADKALSFFRDGFPLALGAAASADISPVENLLIAAGACFALTVRSIIAARRLPKASFEVIVIGEKARDLPSRLDQLSLLVLFENLADEIQAAAIVEEAKQSCTVTNTLTGTAHVNVKSGKAAALPGSA